MPVMFSFNADWRCTQMSHHIQIAAPEPSIEDYLNLLKA